MILWKFFVQFLLTLQYVKYVSYHCHVFSKGNGEGVMVPISKLSLLNLISFNGVMEL